MKKKFLIKSYKQMFMVIGIFTLILLVGGTTYAFFNYTRTGASNTVRTGIINFTSTQARINLSNIFPIATSAVSTDTDNVGTATITVTGDTTYDKGIEYLISATNVTNTVGTKNIPISISTTVSGTLGTSDEDYFNNRETATNHIYKVLAKDTISNDDQLMVGYIAKGQAGINGTITIKAYIDKDNILISDTYPEGSTTINGVTYYNGTPTTDKIVLTTEEWNSLNTNGISFQVKVESRDGTWVENPNRPICQRITNELNLHTITCNQSSPCSSDGYTGNNTTITYGNAKPLGSTLAVGDAFDCDVNGDGNYNERFYYISDYYDSSTNSFDNNYATLIYYRNFYNGVPGNNNVAYDSSDYSYYGPRTASPHLPSFVTWSNIELKSNTRAILTDNGLNKIGSMMLPTAFSYENYGARFLTTQEVANGCGLSSVGSLMSGELSNMCKFLLEETMYADSNNSSFGYWLENPKHSSSYYIARINSSFRYIGYTDASYVQAGVRPAIDVAYSKLAY